MVSMPSTRADMLANMRIQVYTYVRRHVWGHDLDEREPCIWTCASHATRNGYLAVCWNMDAVTALTAQPLRSNYGPRGYRRHMACMHNLCLYIGIAKILCIPVYVHLCI